MSVPPHVALVLRDAADLIEDAGWCQKRMTDDDGRFCAVGAIWSVERDADVAERAEREFAMVLGQDVPRWNDAPGRTQAEVVAKLREVAA